VFAILIGLIETSRGELYPFRSVYNTCTEKIQGLTPGWIDIYAYYLPGQSIDISHLPNGVYALTSTANPEGNVHEVDYRNNMGVTYFTLYDLKIRVLSGRITEGLIQK
jgi:hypothetical protein